MDDITLALPVDGELDISSDWLNTNLRDALFLILSPPTCILTKTDTQTIAASNTWTTLSWNNLVADTEDPSTPMYDSGAATKVTITTPGWYECSADICMNIDNSANTFSVGFLVNGTDYYIGDSVGWSTGGVNHATSFVTLLELNASDYVECVVQMTRTSSLTSTAYWNIPRIAVRRVRGLGDSTPAATGPFINDFTLHTSTVNENVVAGKLYLVDCSKKDIKLTLPLSTESNDGDAMIFKRWKGPHDVILIPQGSDTINGLPNAHITDGLHLSQDGQGRWCVLDSTNGGWVTY